MRQLKKKRFLPNFAFEKRLWNTGFKYVAGADEVGRGCFAGPVVAAAVVFSRHSQILENLRMAKVRIDDSKKLTPKQREIAGEWIKKNAQAFGKGSVSAKVINKIGMTKASQMAFRRAVVNTSGHLNRRVDFLLIDYYFVPYVRGLPMRSKRTRNNHKLVDSRARQLAIKDGDSRSISIAAASIIAKVYRDKLISKIGQRPRYQRYHWGKNKGYATKVHRDAIVKHGITGYHRKQFVNTFLDKLH